MKKEEYVSPLSDLVYLRIRRPILEVSLGDEADADNLNEASDYEMAW